MEERASTIDIARQAREASYVMKTLDEEARNNALTCISNALKAAKNEISRANQEDKRRAEEQNTDKTLKARLNIENEKFDNLLSGIDVVKSLPEPLGQVSLARELTDGLNLYRVSAPIGVICIIFESRPEAAVQISSLVVKSGNSVILKGGKEASLSNRAVVEAMREGLRAAKLPLNAIQLVSTREEVGELLKLNTYIDLVVPRGSNSLVANVMASTSIPVLGHADGICSIYLDPTYSEDLAVKVIIDSKCDYPAACNAVETLLIHEEILKKEFFQKLVKALTEKQVTIVADQRCYEAISDSTLKSQLDLAENDYSFFVEHLALKLSMKCVKSVNEAIDLINQNGSHHTEVIISEDPTATNKFLSNVDSSGVYHNCSSRFADGFRYGFGAELGISTNRVHARGPVGIEGLLTYKYIAKGNGQTVNSMKSSDFTHKDLQEKVIDEFKASKRMKKMDGV